MSSIYFAYGRTALKYGLKNLKLTAGSQILIPGYICHVVCDAIKEINLEYIFYNINDNLGEQDKNKKELTKKLSKAKSIEEVKTLNSNPLGG